MTDRRYRVRVDPPKILPLHTASQSLPPLMTKSIMPKAMVPLSTSRDLPSTTLPLPGEAALDAIERRLGQPAYRGPQMLLYHGDSLEMMRSLPSDLIDLTITSPPYNIGKEYETRRQLDDYLGWCASWIAELFRLTANAGALWLNLGYVAVSGKGRAIPIPYLLWNRVPFFLLQEIVWNYGAGVAARHTFSPRNEKFLWYVKNAGSYTFNLDSVRDKDVKYPHQKKNGKLKCNPLGKNPTDVWQFPKVTSGRSRSSAERTPHPAQFPIAVVDRIVKACSHPGDILFDPFLGSGTVAEAALLNGRYVVGCDIDDRYVDIATRRIEASMRRQANLKRQPQLL